MIRFAPALLVFVSLLLGSRAGIASEDVWTEWVATAAHEGSDKAHGLMIYLHGRGGKASFKSPTPDFFIQVARQGHWDLLRLNRSDDIDIEDNDAKILQSLTDEVKKARSAGYRSVIVVGHSRGGWLALAAGGLEGVDAVVGSAPGTATLDETSLSRQRDLLAEMMTRAKTKRVAIFLYEGDPREYVEGGRGPALREALLRSGKAFIVEDRPPDIWGHSGLGYGRFIRRYRDCVTQFLARPDIQSGPVSCDRTRGYAAGSDLDFPKSPRSLPLPIYADRSLGAYVGRWEGDDQAGSYVILEPTEIGENSITFLHGFSPSPLTKDATAWIRELRFVLADGGGRIACELPASTIELSAKPRSDTEIEYDIGVPAQKGRLKFLLHKTAKP